MPLEPVRNRAAEQAHVLLVEDHTAVRQAIAAMFERESDFTVVGQARSLAEARELLHQVDVAVLDLGLPDGDGADLIAELREASPGAQALVLSASLDRAQTARAIEAGAAGALDKTADLDQVVDAVRRARNQHSHRAQPRRPHRQQARSPLPAPSGPLRPPARTHRRALKRSGRDVVN